MVEGADERLPRYKYTRSSRLTLSELEEILAKCDRQWLKALIVFLYYSGARISEALKLSVDDVKVNRAEGCLEVRLPTSKGRRGLGPYKPERLLSLPIDLPHMGLLVEYIEVVGGAAGPRSRLWSYGRSTVWQYMKEVKPDISPHLFRHDRLYSLSAMGVDPYTLRDWAGWSDLKPAENYTRRSGGRLKLLVDVLKRESGVHDQHRTHI